MIRVVRTGIALLSKMGAVPYANSSFQRLLPWRCLLPVGNHDFSASWVFIDVEPATGHFSPFMCGFIGWFRSSGTLWREEERAIQQQVLSMIAHRGPDDGAESLHDGGWMGFRRLSILDLTTHARQPMSFGGGRQTLTFNGEIYNFRELRACLGGMPLDSSGDTAVLGALLEREPLERVLARLRGMFAFAWWDEHTRALTLVRDHFGIKPLYYQIMADGGIVYGSELRAVARLGGTSAVSPSALADFFRWGAVQAPDTFYEGVRCLPPGHMLVWQGGHVETRPWFLPRWPGREDWVQDEAEQQHLVREGMLDSVKAHLVSDVPVGVFLSGGLDSTLITACMRKAGQQKIKAFSIGYEENSGVPDETVAARRSAEFYDCDFVCERLTADTLEARLDDYFDQMDQPTGDALNTWVVSQVAAREVKVVLSGLGADEWWAGYNFHRLISLAARSPLLSAGGLVRALGRVLPVSVRAKPSWKALYYALGGAGRDMAAWHAHGRTITPQAEVARLLQTESPMPAPPLGTRHAPDSWLHELLLRETTTYLANTLLRDNDFSSMAHSLELRVPWVDVEVFALAGRIPPDAKLNTLGGKRVLRTAFRDLLPPWIYDDPKKKGFTLPLMKWMRQPRWQARIRETLGSQACRERGWTDARLTARMCEEYFKSTLESTAVWSLAQRVWQLYLLEEWARRNMGGRA